MQTALAVLPLVVIAVLGSRENAHFYIPFTIAVAVDAAFFSVSTSLVAEGALAPDRLPVLVRLLVRRGVFFAVPLVAFFVAAAPYVMLPFGAEYVRESTQLLRILIIASLFRAVVAVAAAIWRVTGSSGRIAALDGVMLVVLLLAAVPLANALGVVGVALAWLSTTMLVGGAVLPLLIRYYRSGADAGRPPPLVEPPTPPPPSSAGAPL